MGAALESEAAPEEQGLTPLLCGLPAQLCYGQQGRRGGAYLEAVLFSLPSPALVQFRLWCVLPWLGRSGDSCVPGTVPLARVVPGTGCQSQHVLLLLPPPLSSPGRLTEVSCSQKLTQQLLNPSGWQSAAPSAPPESSPEQEGPRWLVAAQLGREQLHPQLHFGLLTRTAPWVLLLEPQQGSNKSLLLQT